MAAIFKSGVVTALVHSWGGQAIRKRAARVKTIGGVPVLGQSLVGASESEHIVFFDKKATDETITAFCDAHGGCSARGHPCSGGIPFAAVESAGRETELSTAAEAHRENIVFMEPEAELQDFEGPQGATQWPDEGSDEVAASADLWGLERIGRPRASATGKGTHIYVLDSGVRVSHQDFGGRAIPTYDASRWRQKVCKPTDTKCAADGRGHGTHCAGSAGGSSFGVAPEAFIRAVNRGGGFSDAYGAMDWITINKEMPAVLTMSFGQQGMSSGAEIALDSVIAAGITITVASGNSNADGCGFTFAAFSSVIAVGSTDKSDERSSFSNYGSCIDIFAPGGKIVSASYQSDDGTKTASGTSMAAPHVAGGAALILEKNPEFTPQEVRQALLDTAEKDALSNINEGSPNLLLKLA